MTLPGGSLGSTISVGSTPGCDRRDPRRLEAVRRQLRRGNRHPHHRLERLSRLGDHGRHDAAGQSRSRRTVRSPTSRTAAPANVIAAPPLRQHGHGDDRRRQRPGRHRLRPRPGAAGRRSPSRLAQPGPRRRSTLRRRQSPTARSRATSGRSATGRRQTTSSPTVIAHLRRRLQLHGDADRDRLGRHLDQPGLHRAAARAQRHLVRAASPRPSASRVRSASRRPPATSPSAPRSTERRRRSRRSLAARRRRRHDDVRAGASPERRPRSRPQAISAHRLPTTATCGARQLPRLPAMDRSTCTSRHEQHRLPVRAACRHDRARHRRSFSTRLRTPGFATRPLRLTFTLTVAATSYAGTYSSTWTLTLSSGP